MMKLKNFTSVEDVQQPAALVEQARLLKQQPLAYHHLGRHKTLGLLFFNASLRTRMSTEVAARNLGMEVMVLNMNADTWKLEFNDGTVMNADRQEHIKEAAAVVSQYCQVLGVRSFPSLTDRQADYGEQIITSFVQYATVPVISLESATLHPLQSLADWLTIEEHKPVARPKVVLSWAPHPKALPQAVANSFLQWLRLAPVELVLAHPPGYELAPQFSAGVATTHNQQEALAGAHFVYAKNWSSYRDYGQVLQVDEDWRIDEEKMSLTDRGYFMHCLPVRRNVVVTDEVLDGQRSLVIAQAENRIYAAQAVLKNILEHADT